MAPGRAVIMATMLAALYAVSPYWSAFWWLSSWTDEGPGYWDRINRPALKHSALVAWKEALAAKGVSMPAAATQRLVALGDQLIAPGEIARMLYAGDPPGIGIGVVSDPPQWATDRVVIGRHVGVGRFMVPFPRGAAWLTLGWSGWKVSAVTLTAATPVAHAPPL